MNIFLYLLPVLAFLGLLAIIVAGYLYDSCNWHYCRHCGHFWNRKTRQRQITMPQEAEGICKPRECECCERGGQ